jgi:hypothetical protein
MVITPALAGQPYEVEEDSAFKARFDEVQGGWLCADASYSLHLPDGRTLWLYGDTFIGGKDADGSILPGFHFIKNSAILDDGESLVTLYSGTPSTPEAFIPTGDTTWYWPEHGMVQNDTIKLFMGRFKSVDRGSPGFNFGFVGMDVVYLSPETFEVIGSRHLSYTDSSGVRYGNQLLQQGDYTYIYGRKDEVFDGVTFKMPHVARVRGNLNNAWEFYNGRQWVDDPAQSQRISGQAVAEQYAVFRHDSLFYLLTHEAFMGKDIYLIPGSAPHGPFDNMEREVIYTTPENYNTYNTWIHPQFTRNDQYLVSYNVNGGFSNIVDNHNLYRPRFLRLDFSPDTATTVGEPMERLQARAYPNPASMRLNIRVQHTGQCVAALYDNNGRLVMEQYFKNTLTIPVTGYPAGVYHLRLQAGNKMHQQNIIIQ